MTDSVNIETLRKMAYDAFPDKVSYDGLVECVIKCMSMVGTISGLKGEQKKDLVIDLVVYVMSDDVEPFIKNVVPQMIDRLIMVEKGKLKFNHKTTKYFKCFKCF